jgi:hypothetical protein
MVKCEAQLIFQNTGNCIIPSSQARKIIHLHISQMPYFPQILARVGATDSQQTLTLLNMSSFSGNPYLKEAIYTTTRTWKDYNSPQNNGKSN